MVQEKDVVDFFAHIVCSHRACTIAQVFCHRYGSSVAAALRSPLTVTDFERPPTHDHTFSPGSNLLTMTHRDMHLLVQNLPKQTILQSLHRIPSYIYLSALQLLIYSVMFICTR
jgi:hypothetical protein